jgi:hypothetical protein
VTGYHRVLSAKTATEQALLWWQDNKNGANVLAIDIVNGADFKSPEWYLRLFLINMMILSL